MVSKRAPSLINPSVKLSPMAKVTLTAPSGPVLKVALGFVGPVGVGAAARELRLDDELDWSPCVVSACVADGPDHEQDEDPDEHHGALAGLLPRRWCHRSTAARLGRSGLGTNRVQPPSTSPYINVLRS